MFNFLTYDADKYCIPAPTKPQTKKINVEDNFQANWNGRDIHVVESSGQIFKKSVEVVDNVRTMSWDQVDKKDDISIKDSTITHADIIEMSGRGLDQNKGAILKPLWSKGMSRVEVASIKRNEKGFSQSTVGKYYAAFSAAIKRSPIATERGGRG